ncbi:MAG TPA: sulfate adenylyltransferase, partial [Anaerolineales bacterium]
LGRNKAVVIDPVFRRKFQLPPLSPKDYQSIELGLKAGIGHIAVSFVRSGESIDEARRATQGRMKIISKVECVDALENLDEIIAKSDFLLIDRGDLSKEVPIEKIPFTQKLIIDKARRQGVDVFVATNLLETMVERRNPTRAEVHDVINTVVDGAAGLTLAAETAVGRYPIECVNMLSRLILHAEGVLAGRTGSQAPAAWLTELESSSYLLEAVSSLLVPPHGGRLVNRILAETPDERILQDLPKIELDDERQMEVEQIANGTYSPLEGFMGEADFLSVVECTRLADGTLWPLPITLDVSEEAARALCIGDTVGLTDESGEVMALLHLTEKYRFDRESMARMVFGTDSADHPGVRRVRLMQPVLLAGPIDLIRARRSPMRAYEQSPAQIRRLFVDRGWSRVLGFHTRNVIHRGHEFMQMQAMQAESCDGLFLHPVIGKKKTGDYRPEYIIKSYEKMVQDFYPQGRAVLAAFSTFSRYAGPREALFTALCRKNFGCSHFIIGRDHTGVGRFYDPYASQRIFDQFPDAGIKIVKFDEVFYSRSANGYVHANCNDSSPDEGDILHIISGSEARAMFLRGETPPGWFMRPEISDIILGALRNGRQVFEA